MVRKLDEELHIAKLEVSSLDAFPAIIQQAVWMTTTFQIPDGPYYREMQKPETAREGRPPCAEVVYPSVEEWLPPEGASQAR